MAVMIQHQYRILRLIMILSIVGLTIFLYASYYTNSSMVIPTNKSYTSTLGAWVSSSSSSSSSSASSSSSSTSSSSKAPAAALSAQQISSQSSADSLTFGDLQQQLDNAISKDQYKLIGDIGNSSAPQSDVSSPSVSLPSSVLIQEQHQLHSLKPDSNQQDQQKHQYKQLSTASAVASVSQQVSQQSSPSAVQTLIDKTIKGIRSGDIYEPGHSQSNAENLCIDSGEQLRLLILVTSAPSHHEARLAIRQTWGHYGTRRDVSIGFMLGGTGLSSSTNKFLNGPERPNTGGGKTIEDLLDAENFMYGDLIRGHFIDSYDNLTLKTISSLEWVDVYCPKVSFILKTDDDMFINVPKLLSFLDKHRDDQKIIYGRLAKKWKPIRNKKSKYFVSPQQYMPPVFPHFTTGPAYLMSSDIIHDLYVKSLNQTYLKLEDVFTTGIVAQLLNIKRVHVNEFLNRRIAFNPCNIRKAISVHMVKSNEQFDLWKKLLDTNTKYIGNSSAPQSDVSSPSVSLPSSVLIQEQHQLHSLKPDSNQQDQQKHQYKQLSTASAVASVSQQVSQQSSPSAVQTLIDKTIKGIRSGDIYEPGHSQSNAENLCIDSGEQLRLLILVTSAPSHHEARLAIRQTWGHYGTRRDVSIGFMLGGTGLSSSTNKFLNGPERPNTGGGKTIEDLLDAENFMYGDLIRGHFIDSYDNLTLKTISSLEWVDVYCPKVSFILKTDDDMFINVPKLLSFLDKHRDDQKIIYGRLAKKWKPIRNKKSKYFVSPQQYMPPVFPHFTTGPAYLMSSDIIHDLYVKSLNQTYLKLEDVFTTGIVAQLLNIKRVHVNEFLNRRIAFNPCNIRKAISVHMVKSNEQFDLWKKLLDTNTKCK